MTGEDAVEIARRVGTRIATVDTQTLFVRQEPSTEASVLGMVPEGEELLVVEETEGWVKVDVEEGTGWVSTDYVILRSEFVQAESKEEERARLAKEEEERRKAREAAAARAAQNNSNAGNSNNTPAETPQPPATYTVGEGSEMGVAVAEYALQFVGNPYVWGGTSLTKGADCSGFVLSVYKKFGIKLSHSSSAQSKEGTKISASELQPGDLIFYANSSGTINHVALYIGGGRVIHASSPSTGIKISKYNYRTPVKYVSILQD